MKIAAIGDIHVKEIQDPYYRDLFLEVEKNAEVLALCGDLLDRGLPSEAENLARAIEGLKIPVLAVLGNHDYNGDRVSEIKKILRDAKMIFLEDQNYEMGDVGFAGTKGFGGGFGNHMLAPFGEPGMRHFAEEGIREAAHLEINLHRLETKYKVVVLHYAPIPQTVQGEPLEIYPFLGSTRLAETIERFDVSAVFHGHAHRGTAEGRMRNGAKVYNCCREVMRQKGDRHFVTVEVPEP